MILSFSKAIQGGGGGTHSVNIHHLRVNYTLGFKKEYGKPLQGGLEVLYE